jgi:hypothetical protein
MTSDRRGRAADEPASAPQCDELATAVTQPIPQTGLNIQALETLREASLGFVPIHVYPDDAGGENLAAISPSRRSGLRSRRRFAINEEEAR